MKTSARFTGATLLALSLSSLAPAQEAVTVKSDWKVGKRYSTTVVMDSTTSISMGEQKMDQKMKVTTETTHTVTKGAEPDSKKMVIKYDRMALDMNMAGQKMSYDSDTPEADKAGIGASFGKVVGQEITAVVGADGKVTSVEMGDGLKSLGSNPMLNGMLSKEGLQQMLSQAGLNGVPEKPVKPGDSWTFSTEQAAPGMGSIKVSGTYVYTKNTEKGGVPCLELTLKDGKVSMGAAKGSAEPGSQAAQLEAMGMKITGGTITGTTFFDNALGMARESDVNMTMTMTMNNPAEPGKTMEIPTKQHITTKLTKVEDVK